MAGLDLVFDTPEGEKSHHRLDEAIHRAPDDPASYLVYADWLQAQGDPRAELIAVQRARIDRPQEQALAQVEAQLIHDHWDHLLGPVALHGDALELRWFCGFLQYARIDARVDHGVSTAELVRMLVGSLSGRFLRELAVGEVVSVADDRPYYDGIIDVLDQTRQPRMLRSLVLGDSADTHALTHRHAGNLGGLRAACPRLEKLAVHGVDVSLPGFHAPALKDLAIVCGGMSWTVIESLSARVWPRLERLNLWLGSEAYGCSVTVEHVMRLLHAETLPALKHLAIMQCEFTDALIPALARSSVAPRLQTLGLAMGTMSDTGLLSFADEAAAFGELRYANVSGNYLSDEGRLLAKKVAPIVTTSPQEDRGSARRALVAR